ncbi:MAG TPA: hypothetical protein ENK18_14140 [Deltaproteobacteria bacterium]|nr:hypothetical protein [Deltaproteobacteria bacterium]
MGEVWRARHRTERVRVAVKVLTAKGSSRPMFVESFRNEVRAVAALEHPHIAMVLDYGSVPKVASDASRGRLVAGTPYLSMELVEGHTLADHMGTLEWPEIERILQCLLDALAHAHARGVIHRDLKLSNVLYDPASGAIKLTDFGIAHAMAATGDPFRWGTPAYMPPEQLLGRWWDYGPWTDLYSLGCCGFALATGERPFPDDVDPSAATRHLPPMQPRMAVPVGFEEWLRGLTEPEPGTRFQLAADAAWALQRVTETPRAMDHLDKAFEQVSRSSGPATTIALAFDLLDEAPPEGETPGSKAPIRARVPPMPSRWRPPRRMTRSTQLLGAGLGLYGLRRIPMVGRTRERGELWSELRAARASGRARVVVVHGPAGSGKTRLGEWLCERANEVGAAAVMRATHSPDGGPSDGLGGMVSRYLRTGGLGPAQILERIVTALRAGGEPEDWSVRGLLELVAPGAEEGQAFSSPAERHAVVRRFVESQAKHRPVLLFVDDVQWGHDVIEFVLSLLEAQEREPSKVLVVLSARDEALAERAQERAMIDDLLLIPGVVRLTVGPLEPDEHRSLVEELLGLEGALARLVEERTAGNPMFAVQLVGDWVQRRILIPGRQGFQLRDGAQIHLPDDLFAAWAGRIDDLLADRSPSDRHALEIAAVLGQRVDRVEWLAACRARGIEPSEDLVDRLLSRRLASIDETGGAGSWTFAHSMLRESLERQAVEAGRASSHHRACAAMLQTSELPDEERLARHLVRAGALARALDPAVDAIEAACQAGEFDRADALLDLWQEAVDGLELHEADPRWIRGLKAAAAVHRYKDRPKRMLHTCQRLETGVERHRWPQELLGYVRMQQGRLARMSGQFGQALELFRDGLSYCTDPFTEATLHARMGQTLVSLGAFAGAEAAFRRCLELARSHGDEVGAGDAWVGLGGIALCQGDLDEATRSAARARDAYRAVRHRWGLATTSEMFGEIARHRRSWDEATHCYRTSAEIWRALGTESAALYADFNMTLVEVERGDADRVGHQLEQLSARAHSFGNRSLWATIRLAQLVSDAKDGDEGAWDRHHKDASDALLDTQFLSPDVALTAELAGRAAKSVDWLERSRDALELAIAQWMRLGREEDADRVRWALP